MNFVSQEIKYEIIRLRLVLFCDTIKNVKFVSNKFKYKFCYKSWEVKSLENIK